MISTEAIDLFQKALKAPEEIALQYYQAALQLNPEYAEAHNNLATLLLRKKNVAEAQAHYIHAIRLHPDYLEAHLNLGLVFLIQKQYPAAIKQFNNVLSLHAHSLSAHWHLANIYWQLQETDKAEEYWQKIITINPQDVEALNNLGAVAIQRKNTDKALIYFKQALTVDPKHKIARSNLASLLLQKNQLKEALWHYSLYLNLVPQDSEAHYNSGVALMLLGQLSQAIEHFEHAIHIRENYPEAYCNLAAIYLRLNNSEQARLYYQKTLQFQPSHAIAGYMRAALTGEAMPAQTPTDYIKNLFDHYAGHFDIHLLNTLHYRLPELLYQYSQPYLQEKKWRILDLGCGTGLAGAAFRKNAQHITGVDLSANMLAQAQKKNNYDQLIEGEILQILIKLEQKFDLILCLDTLVYFGVLDPIFSKIYERLNTHGLFGFSIELGKKFYQLEKTGRYRHNRLYVTKLIKKIGFEIVKQGQVDGRHQAGESVRCGLFLVQKK